MKINQISDWITVSQEEINKPTSETKNGIKIHFMISPFDVPVATRAGDVGDLAGITILMLQVLTREDPRQTRGIGRANGR